jgi:hypothetical protein
MRKFECDGCGDQVAHEGPEIPAHWAEINVCVRWRGENKDGCSEYDSDNPRILCSKCRRGSMQALLVIVERGIAEAIDTRPRPASAS